MTDSRALLLIDGMSLLFRAYYATSYNGRIMRTSSGVPTNAIFGFIKYFWSAVQHFQPSHVACCWDMGKRTFRTDLYHDYKANRLDPPEDLIPQFDLIKEVMASFGVANIGVAGYEADDCMGTLAKRFCEEIDIRILTGDHDCLQLLSDRIHVIIMQKGQANYKVYTPETLWEEKGLTPEQIIDLKGLMGDPSDNYPGVKGIGEKTAMKLLQEFHSIDGIIENLEALPNSVRRKIEANLEMLHLSRNLARIRCDVPISCILDDCIWSLDPRRVIRHLEELELYTLIRLIS